MQKTTKKNNRYKLSLTRLSEPNDQQIPSTLTLEVENHDDIFKIIEITQSKHLFERDSDAQEFAIGIKLFTEVMIRNRELGIFTELKPAIGDFMKKLKAI
jgi:hypothetical protein